ncbi:hypothetical protein I350_03655 [Cryptococcus amylolentus CBS 6273]|uniref:CTLH domain-containing protein n=1 Tax=Cryptococcus amylolentus CBS 6273 TaxID=1296118 RepID=A0A1E3K770_9TREE|nr:hypothetical protein I350_03655 [Cryptococcus amylolentus CBS 6273]
MAPASNNPLVIEEPLIRTSYELLRRSHKSAQRQVEKDFKAVDIGLSNLLKSLNDKSATEDGRAAIVAKLDQISERPKGLKRKLDDIQPSKVNPTALSSRVAYMELAHPGSTKAPAKKSKAKAEVAVEPEEGESSRAEDAKESKDAMEVDQADAATMIKNASQGSHQDTCTLDRYIVDYLLRKGRLESAKALAQAQHIEASTYDVLVDIKLFAELVKIEKALVENHSCAEALAWCGENRGTLKKTKNNLEFTVRLQEFIELCRKRDTTAAVAYARKNLSSWAATHMADFQKGMTLLVFGERTGVIGYRTLYDQSRWESVRDQFRETFLDIYAQPSQPLLSLSLSAGLASLRLPSCVHHTQMVTGNVDCPTCDENLRVLASEVPMSHHVNSTIVCRISGEVMDSENGPMAFPNGYALKEMAKNNFDVVTCPRTRETCAFARLRKVYIS